MTHPTPAIVDGDWLEARLGDPEILIVDATTQLKHPDGDGYYTLESGREGFLREHIPGAVFADVLGEFADPDAPHPMTVPPSDQFARAAGGLGISNEVHVVVYDQIDVARGPEYYQFWASRFWWHLRLEGHVRVSVLDGGLGLWKRQGRPVEAGPSERTPAHFESRRRPELLATLDQVSAATQDPKSVLVSVLDADTFSGRKQVYARRGHIPTSENLFFGQLVDPETGGYRPTEDARPLLEKVGALDPSRKPIIYCGGGIAATVAALQLSRLGRDDVAIYDGSMTEWASDAERPLVVTA